MCKGLKRCSSHWAEQPESGLESWPSLLDNQPHTNYGGVGTGDGGAFLENPGLKTGQIPVWETKEHTPGNMWGRKWPWDWAGKALQ